MPGGVRLWLMPERVLLIEDASHKLTIAAAGTTAPPVNPTDGFDISVWKLAQSSPRRAALRLVAAAALNATAISVWSFFDGGWSKIQVIPDVAFVAGDLSRTVFVDFPIGARLAVAYTASASTVAITAYSVESSVI